MYGLSISFCGGADGNEADASQRMALGEPIGRSSHIELRNMHLTYAITWFVARCIIPDPSSLFN